jgi:hypothetical protein
MEYEWKKVVIDVVLPCGNRYITSNVTIFIKGDGYKDELGAVIERRDGWLFVFLSAAQAIAHGVGGFSAKFTSPFGGGSQSIYFPKECATTDQEIGEFTISLLKAGRRKFMESTPKILELR